MKSHNYDAGKLDPTLVLTDMPTAFQGYLEVRQFGVHKYDRMNWSLSKGDPCEHEKFYQKNLASLLRHAMALARGEKIDPESGLKHADLIQCRAGFASEYDGDLSHEAST